MEQTENTPKRPLFFADSMLFLAVLGWAISFPVAKLAMNDWGNHRFFFLAGRFWLAFAIFAMLAIKKGSWQKLMAHAKPGFWVGITLVATYGFQYKALSPGFGTAGKVAFITALNSVLVPIGMWFAFKKRVKAVIWLGLIIATVGAILVEYEGTLTISSAGLLAFIAAVGMAADIILVDYFMNQKKDKQTNKYEKVPFLVMQFLVLATGTTLLSVLTEIPAKGIPAWSNNAVFGMIFMAIVATAGAFFIQTKYQPMTSPERAALVFILEPPLAGLFGYLLLGEAFTSTMVIGAVLIIIGVAFAEILVARHSNQDTQKPPEPQDPQGGAFAEVLPERSLSVSRADAVPVLSTPSQSSQSVSEK